VLHGHTAVPVTFVAFDLLRVDGHDVTCNPWGQRRTLLEGIWRECGCARLADVFDDGQTLFGAVVSYGLEEIVAKRRDGVYRSGQRDWMRSRTRVTGGGKRSSS
jgi:bifunctional non-homologous end joining protein LigD